MQKCPFRGKNTLQRKKSEGKQNVDDCEFSIEQKQKGWVSSPSSCFNPQTEKCTFATMRCDVPGFHHILDSCVLMTEHRDLTGTTHSCNWTIPVLWPMWHIIDIYSETQLIAAVLTIKLRLCKTWSTRKTWQDRVEEREINWINLRKHIGGS